MTVKKTLLGFKIIISIEELKKLIMLINEGSKDFPKSQKEGAQ